MKRTDDGGSAFPEPRDAQCGGMSLRDYLAAKAMAASRSRPSQYSSWDDLADDSYEIADAMLRRRLK